MIQLFTYGQHEDLPGGKRRTMLGLKPVNYFANGLFRPITSRLGNSGDPNLPVGVDELVQFRLRNRLSGNAPVAHFGKGNSYVRFTPLGTANVLGRAVGVQGFEYPEAWPNADLRFTIAGHRLQKEILLRAGHPMQFQFRLDDHAGLDIDKLETPDFRILQPTLEPPAGSAELAKPLTWLKSVQGGKTVLTVTLPTGDWRDWTLDPTLTLQPDATDGLDNRIRSVDATNNYGVSIILGIGNRDDADNSIERTTIKFDLSGLPGSADITSATLSLMKRTDLSANVRTFRVYRQKRAWTEGTGNDTQSGDGVTWNTYDGVNNWQTAGGFGADDCEQTDIGSRSFTATETLEIFADFSLTATTKAALDLGNGWLLKADTEVDDAYLFYSSDHATAANRPKLVVEYTLPGGTFPVLRPAMSGWSWWKGKQ